MLTLAYFNEDTTSISTRGIVGYMVARECSAESSLATGDGSLRRMMKLIMVDCGSGTCW